MAGTKTSVWLPDDLHSKWKDSGLSLTEIVRRGLDAITPDDVGVEAGRAMLREELADQDGRTRKIVREELERIAGTER